MFKLSDYDLEVIKKVNEKYSEKTLSQKILFVNTFRCEWDDFEKRDAIALEFNKINNLTV